MGEWLRVLEPYGARGNEASQAFVDSDHVQYQLAGDRALDLSLFDAMTRLPLRIPTRFWTVNARNCIALESVLGLPHNVNSVDFSGCTALTSVTGLPSTGNLREVDFSRCISLTTVAGLPQTTRRVFFSDCTALTDVQGLPDRVEFAAFDGCRALRSVAGLPARVVTVSFSDCEKLTHLDKLPDTLEHLTCCRCTSLKSMAQLPSGITFLDVHDCSTLTDIAHVPEELLDASFRGCTALTRVPSLPACIRRADFSGCTALTSVRGVVPNASLNVLFFTDSSMARSLERGPNLEFSCASFVGCRRLHRWSINRDAIVSTSSPLSVTRFFHFVHAPSMYNTENPADEVRACMRSGVGEKLLVSVGPDVAAMVGCFVTAGFNSSALFGDHIETCARVRERYTGAQTNGDKKE